MRSACLLLLASVLGLGCDPAPALDWDDPRTVGSEPAPIPEEAEAAVFAVIGDFGIESDAQARVAGQVAQACADAGCGFALMLGDNLYDTGLNGSEASAARLRALVDSYPDIPKFFVLGNHDWHPVRTELARAQRELEWIGDQDDTFGEFHYYDFRAGPAHFWAMDSNWIVRNLNSLETSELAEWGSTIGATDAPWVITFGHHPLLSNGRHGNAGSYRDTGADWWEGQGFLTFLSRHVVGTADLYLAGHDHNLNFFPGAGGPTGGGTATMVSGAAAKCRAIGPVLNNPGDGATGSGVTATYERYGFGFAIVTASRTELVVTMHPDGGAPWTTRRTVDDDTWTIDGGSPSVDINSRCP